MKWISKFSNYLKDVKKEFSQITFISKSELYTTTGIVVLLLILFGAVFTVIDLTVQFLIRIMFNI